MVNIKQMIVPDNLAKRVTYGSNNKKQYITIHQTGNTSKGANAGAHARLQANGNSRSASWHYQVDDKEIIQSFSDNAQCWHAGDGRGTGNLNSIGIELCINSDGDYKKTLENGAELVRHLMAKYNIPIINVKQHNHWSGKNCPAQIRAGKEGISWNDFLNMVSGGQIVVAAPKTKVKSTNVTNTKKSISQMVQEVIDGKHGNGHVNRRKSLGISNVEYEKVRAEVNRRLGSGQTQKSKPKKSISQMANEVIAGKHGNGHESRRKSLGISKSEYEKVRREVNRRLK